MAHSSKTARTRSRSVLVMPPVARYAKATAKPGEGERLVAVMVEVAASLRSVAGCELYVVNRVPGEPDTVWITELWRSQEALDGGLAAADGGPDGRDLKAEVMALVEDFSRIDLEPVGGVGAQAPPRGGWERVALSDLEDSAPGYGLSDIQEMRVAAGPLGLERTGISLQRLRPGCRQAFGHVHANAEETYVVLTGSGTLRIEDDEVALEERVAVRVAPELTRAFEAGPDGLEFLAVGPRCEGDGEIVNGWWGSPA